MGTGLGRLEYWLLDVVAEFAVPVQALRTGEIEIALNRPSLGASPAQLAHGLVALLDRGLGTVETDAGGQLDAAVIERLISLPVNVTSSRVASDITRIRREHARGGWFGLTAVGGAEWERAARPDWSRYVEYCTWPEGDGWEHTIICTDALRAERYLAFQRSVWHEPGAVSEESIARDRLRPWQATYWKVLPEAYVIRFRTGADAQRYPPLDEANRWDYRWHSDPWETAGR